MIGDVGDSRDEMTLITAIAYRLKYRGARPSRRLKMCYVDIMRR